MPIARVGNPILGNDRPGRCRRYYKHDEGWHRTPVIGLNVENDTSASAMPSPRSSVRASG